MNSITIEQTQEEMALAFEVQRNAAICAVRLSRSKMASQPVDEVLRGPVVITVTVKSRTVEAPKGKLRVEVDFRIAGEMVAQPAESKKPAQRETVISLECTYAVDYELREGFEPSAELVKAFKDGNVIFNCWPYFREYLQESVQRMGLPPLTVPFLRVQPKPPKATKKDAEKPKTK
ncbi:MAG: hypothetical protein ABSD56_01945 [Bryobacteraceae bacterium]